MVAKQKDGDCITGIFTKWQLKKNSIIFERNILKISCSR